MLNNFSDILPKTAVAAIALWGGVSYFILAPEVGSRVVRADFRPACEANYKVLTAQVAEKQLAKIPLPTLDAGREARVRQLQSMLNNPIIGQLDQLNIPGMSGFSEARTVLKQIEEQKKTAVQSYNKIVEKLKQDTNTTLAKSGSYCGCVADVAISETRTDWALFSGSLGMIRPTSLRQFGQRMEAVSNAGQCVQKVAE